MIGLMRTAVEAVQGTAPSLGVEPPIRGPIWSIGVPVLLFVFAAVATYLLYHHFASRKSGDDP